MVPYDKRSGKIWYNSELVDWADAKIHVLNHGLHYASCVFEGERVYDGSIFKLEEHTSRLFYSAERMGMTIPYSEKEINDRYDLINKFSFVALIGRIPIRVYSSSIYSYRTVENGSTLFSLSNLGIKIFLKPTLKF